MDFAYAYNPLLLKRVLRRDRAIVGIALLILILLAWLYVGRLATSVQVAGMEWLEREWSRLGAGW
jgi:predicted metal-binding membrane protein